MKINLRKIYEIFYIVFHEKKIYKKRCICQNFVLVFMRKGRKGTKSQFLKSMSENNKNIKNSMPKSY